MKSYVNTPDAEIKIIFSAEYEDFLKAFFSF